MKHYVYRLDDPITKEFYIGRRSCKYLPIDDPYMGSYYTWKPVDKSRLIKTILKSNFRKIETCIKYEAELIKENIDDELNRNYHIPNKGFYTNGCPVSKEARKKISNKLKGRTHTAAHKLKNRLAHLGIIPSDETRKKLSDVNKGKTINEETKIKLSDANSLFIYEKYTKSGEYIESFTGMFSALISIGKPKRSNCIYNNCTARSKSAGGFMWKRIKK